MKASLGSCLLLGLVAAAQTPIQRERDATYTFDSWEHRIVMEVTHFDSYLGARLSFFNSAHPAGELCYGVDGKTGAKCLDRFVGAVAVVRYSVKLINGGVPTAVAIREQVTLFDHSPGLGEMQPFSLTQMLGDGIGSDLQIFGYDEDSVNRTDRARIRKQAGRAWRLYRQELYMNREREPFATVEWRHNREPDQHSPGPNAGPGIG